MVTFPGKHWGPNYFKNQRQREKRAARAAEFDLARADFAEAEKRELARCDALAGEYAERCGWEMTAEGFYMVHRDDLKKAFLSFLKDVMAGN